MATDDPASKDFDSKAFLNTPHVPEDAGEYVDDLAEILNRIPDGWGRWISCGKGWYPLVVETHRKLLALDELYTPFQIKEKFARLNYYHSVDTVAGQLIEDEAWRQSGTICEECGEPGYPRSGSYVQTLCDEHGGHREEWKR